MPPAATKSKKAIFSTKVKVKVTRSLTLVSFERASLVEYACQIWSLYTSNGSKVIAKVKVDNKQTDRQDKNNMPPIIRSGGIKKFALWSNQKLIPLQMELSKHMIFLSFFMPQAWKVRRGHLVIGSPIRPSVCTSVCLSVIPYRLQTKCNI